MITILRKPDVIECLGNFPINWKKIRFLVILQYFHSTAQTTGVVDSFRGLPCRSESLNMGVSVSEFIYLNFTVTLFQVFIVRSPRFTFNLISNELYPDILFLSVRAKNIAKPTDFTTQLCERYTHKRKLQYTQIPTMFHSILALENVWYRCISVPIFPGKQCNVNQCTRKPQSNLFPFFCG